MAIDDEIQVTITLSHWQAGRLCYLAVFPKDKRPEDFQIAEVVKSAMDEAAERWAGGTRDGD